MLTQNQYAFGPGTKLKSKCNGDLKSLYRFSQFSCNFLSSSVRDVCGLKRYVLQAILILENYKLHCYNRLISLIPTVPRSHLFTLPKVPIWLISEPHH